MRGHQVDAVRRARGVQAGPRDAPHVGVPCHGGRDAVAGVGATERGELLTLQRGEGDGIGRSEEHTSELQSQSNLVCRLLLEKKKKNNKKKTYVQEKF